MKRIVPLGSRGAVLFIFLLPVLLFSAGVSLFAETVTITEEGLTVFELHQLASEDNTSIKQAARSILQTERGLEPVFTLDKTSIGVRSEYGYGEPEGDDSGHSLSLTTSASVPVIPQLQLGGSVHFPILGTSRDSAAAGTAPGTEVSASGEDSAVIGSVSLTLSPFAGFIDTSKNEAAYEKALIALEYLEKELYFSVEAAVLDYLAASKDRDVKNRILELKEEIYSVKKQEYEMGEAAIPDVSDALDEVTTARKEYYSAENTLISAAQSLSLTLGETQRGIEIADIPQAEIDGLIESRSETLDGKGEAAVGSRDLDDLLIDLKQLRAELKATKMYEPDLDISAVISFPDSGFSGTVSFSFSPDDIQNDEVDTLQENILSKEEQLTREQFSLELQRQILLTRIAANLEFLELNRSALKDAELTLEEVRFLAQEGERTSLELASAALDVRSAELRLFQSACGVVSAQADLLLLYR